MHRGEVACWEAIIHFLLFKWLGDNVGCSGTFKDLFFHSALCQQSGTSYTLFSPSSLHAFGLRIEKEIEFCNCISKHLQLTCYVFTSSVYASCPVLSSPEGKFQEEEHLFFIIGLLILELLYPQYLEQFSHLVVPNAFFIEWIMNLFQILALSQYSLHISCHYCVSPSHKNKYALCIPRVWKCPVWTWSNLCFYKQIPSLLHPYTNVPQSFLLWCACSFLLTFPKWGSYCSYSHASAVLPHLPS